MLLILVVLGLMSLAEPGFAGIHVLAPVHDNSIHRDWEDLCGTYAPDYPDLVVQTRESLPSVVRSLLLFDLSQIPLHGQILSAQLRLYCVLETEYVTNEFHVSALTESWNPLSVTWCERDEGTSWCVGGGCIETETQSSTVIPASNPDPWGGHPVDAWFEWDVKDIVQGWHTGTMVNHGFCLWQTPQFGHGRNQRVHFAAKDHPQAATLGPQLIVTLWDPVAVAPGSWSAVKGLFR
jgi:hypothetical protein